MQIAIDGPAGAGKSTIAKLLAKELGYTYIDTGAMYRAVGLYMIRNKIDCDDEAAVSAACEGVTIDLKYNDGIMSIYLNMEDVTDDIRTQEAGQAASVVSTYAYVRLKLVELQRKMAESGNVVMDGRDIGTNVLKNAELKIFLTASSYVRALRRAKELQDKGEVHNIAHIQEEIELRDKRDMTRKINPLCKADTAVEIDCSELSIAEVVAAVQKELKRYA